MKTINRLFGAAFSLSLSLSALSAHAAAWDTTFETTYPGYGYSCESVLAYGSTVYVAGTDPVTGRHTIYKWSSTAGWSLLTQYTFDGNANYLAVYSGYLYFAGSLGAGYDASGAPVMTLNNIGKIRLSDGLMQTLGTGLVGSVKCLAVGDTTDFGSGDFLYVGGVLTQAGGNSVLNIARWNGSRWDGMSGGLYVSSSPYVMDGVWGLSVDTVYPSYPTTYPAHRVVATGHFALGPNIAVYYPAADWTRHWSAVQTGIASVCVNDCTWSTGCYGRDDTVRSVASIGNVMYMLMFDVTRIDSYYVLADTPPGSYCPQAPLLLYQAKAVRTTSTVPTYFSSVPLSVWDGSQGWPSADSGIDLLYANGGILYAIGLGISDYPNNHISTYSGGHWTTLATFTEGYNWGQNALSKYADLFLATPYYPKRWH